MRAISGYTSSQLRYSAKLKPNELQLLLIMQFEICPFKALSRDPWWRHEVFKTTVHNFSKGSMYLPSLKKIQVCSMAKVPSTKSLCFVYGIFPIRKRRRRRRQKTKHNNNNTFSASLKRAEKLKIKPPRITFKKNSSGTCWVISTRHILYHEYKIYQLYYQIKI